MSVRIMLVDDKQVVKLNITWETEIIQWILDRR